MRRWLASLSLTDVVAQLLGQERVFVEQSQALVHPLLDHVEMRVHLQAVIVRQFGLGSSKIQTCLVRFMKKWMSTGVINQVVLL